MVDYGKIDKKLVEHICDIAKLELTEAEKERYVKEIQGILEVFKQIDEVDTKGIEPSFHPYKVENIWREDETKKTEWDPLYSTKLKEKGYFKGPKIL
jgi:aspartyl-tRNA(Asn)/glutamyl-tRNA(Gln) amidotransferase subunit C